MSRADRIAKIHRELTELKARLSRIEAECFLGKRTADELSTALEQLQKQGGEHG